MKIFEGKAVQHSSGRLDLGQKGQKQKFGFCVDVCDSILGQIC